MHREHNRDLALHRFDRVDDPRERITRVDVAWAVQCQYGVILRRQTDMGRCVSVTCRRLVLEERVDHDVPDEVDLLGRNSLALQVVVGVGGRSEQVIGDRVRDEAIDLLRHRTVEAPQTGLDMDHWDAQLHRGQGSGHRGVRVTNDQDEVAFRRLQDLFELHHHLRGLLCMGSRSDPEVEVRVRDGEVLEECPRHQVVVVLAGVHENCLYEPDVLHRLNDGSDLHEIGPRADDRDDPHRLPLVGGFRGRTIGGIPGTRSGVSGLAGSIGQARFALECRNRLIRRFAEDHTPGQARGHSHEVGEPEPECDTAESQGDGGTEEGVARESHGCVKPSQGPSQRSKRDA